MYHHGTESYEVATGKAAAAMKVRLEEMFHKAGPRVSSVIDQVERDVPNDMVVAGRTIEFDATEKGIKLSPQNSGVGLAIHQAF